MTLFLVYVYLTWDGTKSYVCVYLYLYLYIYILIDSLHLFVFAFQIYSLNFDSYLSFSLLKSKSETFGVGEGKLG